MVFLGLVANLNIWTALILIMVFPYVHGILISVWLSVFVFLFCELWIALSSLIFVSLEVIQSVWDLAPWGLACPMCHWGWYQHTSSSDKHWHAFNPSQNITKRNLLSSTSTITMLAAGELKFWIYYELQCNFAIYIMQQ